MSKKPNILFFLTDDQRFDSISCMGCDEIHTPNIDNFAKDSVVFEQAHIMGGTNGAVCMPSRAMIQTGRNLFDLAGEGIENGSYIPKEHKLIPECMRENGYFTYHIGKWHQDVESFNRAYINADRITGIRQTYVMGYHYTSTLLNYDPSGKYEVEDAYNLLPDGKKITPCITNMASHSTDIFSDATIDFINNYDNEKPFYLYVATHAPHDPRHCPNEFEEMYTPSNVSCPPNFMEQHPFDNGELSLRDEVLDAFPRRKYSVRRHISDYYSMIAHIDSRFGDIIKSLKDKGIYDDTIIVFAGDNGLALGQHGLLGKQSLYDHSVRVPLMIKFPNSQYAQRNDAYCYLLDIFPSLCEACGIQIPETVQGKSLLPIVKGESTQVYENLFGAYRNFQRSYKKNGFKLIEYFVDENRHTQLFNLKEDKWEMNNLALKSEYQELLKQMQSELREEQIRMNDPLVTKTKTELNDGRW